MGILPIGFFAPLPLAIMIPFMAAQSFAMGHAFGTSFQYGKRKISSMSNEEFNALDSVALHQDLQTDIRAMIPSMNESFHRMESFQIEIIQSMMNTFVKAVDAFGQFLSGGGNTGTGKDFGAFGDIDFTGGTEAAQHEAQQGFPEWIQHAHGDDSKFVPTDDTKTETKKDTGSLFRTRILSGYYNANNTTTKAMINAWNQYSASDKNTLAGKFQIQLSKVGLQEAKIIADKKKAEEDKAVAVTKSYADKDYDQSIVGTLTWSQLVRAIARYKQMIANYIKIVAAGRRVLTAAQLTKATLSLRLYKKVLAQYLLAQKYLQRTGAKST